VCSADGCDFHRIYCLSAGKIPNLHQLHHPPTTYRLSGPSPLFHCPHSAFRGPARPSRLTVLPRPAHTLAPLVPFTTRHLPVNLAHPSAPQCNRSPRPSPSASRSHHPVPAPRPNHRPRPSARSPPLHETQPTPSRQNGLFCYSCCKMSCNAGAASAFLPVSPASNRSPPPRHRRHRHLVSTNMIPRPPCSTNTMLTTTELVVAYHQCYMRRRMRCHTHCDSTTIIPRPPMFNEYYTHPYRTRRCIPPTVYATPCTVPGGTEQAETYRNAISQVTI
jgi:hypothetical protein